MKVDLDADSISVESERKDADLARAASDLVSGAVDLADTVGARECEWCEDRGRLRPYQVTVDGAFQVLDICADCQADFVEQAREVNEADGHRLDGGEGAEWDLGTSDELGPDGLPDDLTEGDDDA